jgi:hypothetical protein
MPPALFASLVLLMAAATKKRKEKKKLTLGRLALVLGTQETLSNLFWRLSISMLASHFIRCLWLEAQNMK